MKKQVFALLLVVISLLSSATAWGQEPACKIGEMTFNTLQEALAYVNSYPEQEMTIIMLKDYTLPAGTYTLPAKATLLVPMSDEQEACIPIEELYISHNAAAPQNVWVKPTKFRSLTFANGVNMNVYGTIELSGKLHASSDDYTSSPYGPYGLLHMNEGAKMTLMKDSELRAWGFMTGTGETDARRGSTVREIFQMGDWKGGSISSMLLGSDKGVFPVTQYYIQNIESPVKYHPGALLSTMAAVSASASSLSVTAKADVAIIGVSGTESMFLMDEEADQENTWVRKWYDTTKDQQVYEINSGAHIGSIVINLGDFIEGSDLKMNSSAFVLPLTNNMKIHLLSGLMDFTQNTALLPGAEVEINKESVVSITKNEDENVKSGALYIYDADQWGKYAYAKDGFKYTKVVRYTPSANGQPTKRNAEAKPDDASINVHGTFDTNNGYIFTSQSGANIFSTNEDAGTFVLSTKPLAIGESAPVFQIYNDKGDTEEKQFVPAKLKNGDNTSYTTTAGKSAGKTYCYMADQWLSLMTVDCYALELNEAKFAELMLGNATDFKDAFKVFIKPRAYEQISLQKLEVELIPDSVKEGGLPNQDMDDFTFFASGNEDHTFSDKATGNRRFILMNNNCQWWEVEPVEVETDLFHCIHPLNDTYYYWDEENEEWTEKRYTVTWKNGEDVIDTYELPRGTMAEFLGTNPTKPMDEGYTYTFTGWTPALAPVTENATYTAVYKSTPRKYTVTLKSDVEGACSFTGAGAYDYGTTNVAISATMNPGYKFVGWEHDNTLGQSFTIDKITGDVTYTVLTEAVATPEVIRAVQEGYYYTICMPKAMTNVQGATFWQFVGRDANSAYIEPVATPTEAGKPYLMYATTTGDVTATLEGEAAITAGTNGALYGTFIDMDQAAFNTAGDNIYILIANVLRRVDGQSNNSLSAYRAYVDLDNLNPISGSMLTPNVRRVALGTNTATGVDQVQGDEVQSSKVLINGQMFIYRNGNMYDAQGKLVK